MWISVADYRYSIGCVEMRISECLNLSVGDVDCSNTDLLHHTRISDFYVIVHSRTPAPTLFLCLTDITANLASIATGSRASKGSTVFAVNDAVTRELRAREAQLVVEQSPKRCANLSLMLNLHMLVVGTQQLSLCRRQCTGCFGFPLQSEWPMATCRWSTSKK